MRRLLIAIFSLWASFAGAQGVNVYVPNGGNQATEEWTKQYADGWLKRLTTPPTTEEPPIDPPDPNNPTDPTPCTSSPATPTVSNVTNKSIRLNVAATGITNINWFVYEASAPTVNLRTGSRSFSTVMDIGWSNELAPGNYGVRIQGVNCTGSSSTTFEVTVSTPELPACDAGPTINSVYDATTNGLTFQFHGNNVTMLRYIVKNGSGSLRTGDIAPNSSTIIVTFSSAIPVGDYTLRIEGVNCSGFSEKAFTAVQATTPTDPNDPTLPVDPATLPCATTPQILSITNIGNKDLKVTIDGFGAQGTTTTPTQPTNPTSPDFDPWNVGGWSGEVWKPANYSNTKTYPVVYIHDAYTLYQKNGHPDGSWKLDERVQNLINSATIDEVIIVSINTPDRMQTLLPNKPFYTMSEADRNKISSNNGGGPRADETISMMVNQLKPYIDQNYSTKKDRENTIVIGASMGGIFAIYAFSERNDIFGKMAALSPHYQGTLIDVNDNLFTDDMVNYISSNFPNANTGSKAYFDRGTTSLDENYATPQNQVNTILASKGYGTANFKAVVFQGGGHTNIEWGEHVPGLFSFLVPKSNAPPISTPTSSINWYIYKTSAPLLYLRQGNVPYAKTFTLAWSVDLEGGDYGLKLQAVTCQGVVSQNFIIPVSNNPIPCASAPLINGISLSSKTFLTFTWTGLNVPEVVWNIKQNGNTVRSGSFIPDANQTRTVQYNELGPGTYELQLVGLSCATTNPGVSFTLANDSPVVIAKGKKYITMNLTGYGWDKTTSSGISTEWMERIEAFLNLNWQGQSFKGIGGIQVHIKWHEYEPQAGNYDDANLQKIVNYCAQRGLVLSICFTPYRSEGDGFVPDGDRATTVTGDTWWFEGKDWQLGNKHYMVSMNSDIGRAKMRACVKHMAQFLKQYNNVDFMALVTANTEEYQLVRYDNPITMTGYSQIDQQKWATFSGNQPVTRPNPPTGMDGIWNWIGSPLGKLWGDFQTEALRGFQTEFTRGVREGGMRVSAFYAGIGAPSGAFDFSTRLDRIYSAGTSDQPDIIYSSEGGSCCMMSKVMATDLNAGTFPGSDYAIEFDPEDLSRRFTDFPPYDAQLFGDDLWTYASSFFRRGGHIVHMAMAFHPTANVHHLTEALYKIKTQFLDSNSGMTGIEQGEQINHTVTGYGGQTFRDTWNARGGGLNKQVKIKLQ